MFDLIKKTILTGVGLAAMSRDKIEELAKELKEKGSMSEKEGKELIDDLLKKSEQSRKDLETTIEELILKVLEKTNMATKTDILRLEQKIKDLEQKDMSAS